MPVGVNRELLPEGELDDGLVLAAPEERAKAPKDRDPESDYRPHHAILSEIVGQEETSLA
jgi:hypothetical protein